MALEYPQIARDIRRLRVRRPNAAILARDQATWVVGLIFGAMTLLCPLDGAVSLPLGELSSESYALIALLSAPAVLFLMITTKTFRLPKDLTLILALIILAILLSTAANLPTILRAATKGRHGLEKAISSSLVPIIGMYISIYARNLVPYNINRYFVNPILIGSSLVAAVGLLEVAAIYIGGLRGLSDKIYLLTHAGLAENKVVLLQAGGVTDARVSSILFEPADFGTYVIYVTPWLMATLLSRESNYGRTIPVVFKKLTIISILAALFISVLFSGRTAAVGMPVMVVGYIGLCFCAWLSFNRVLNKITCLFVMLVAVLFYILPVLLILSFKDQIVTMVVSSGTVSNITRFGTTVILLDLFRDNPFFGIGMGQYGFYVAQYVPYWAYTDEFQRWLGNLSSSFFPSFAIFARLGGELGVFGLASWVCFLGALLFRVFRNLRVSYFSNGAFPYYGIAIATSFFSVGVSGMGMASYRVFWLWALLGLASIYALNPLFIDLKRPLRTSGTPSRNPARRFA
jgi:hypothetical protein